MQVCDLHVWSGWPDSNRRPPAPKAGALTKLRHIPLNRSVAYRPQAESRRPRTALGEVPRPAPVTAALGRAAGNSGSARSRSYGYAVGAHPTEQAAGRAGVAQWQSPSLPSWS
jgi:hypothetical protein